MTAPRNRQPAGAPTGGQFATTPKGPSGIELEVPDMGDPRPGEWSYEESDDGRLRTDSRPMKVDNVFNERARRLLGAGTRAKVTVTEERSEYDISGMGVTWESSENITVTADDKSTSFESLPELIAELEHVDHRPTAQDVVTHLGERSEFTVKGHRGQPVKLPGRIGNARGSVVLLIAPTDDTAYRQARLSRNTWVPDGGDERYIWLDTARIYAFDIQPG